MGTNTSKSNLLSFAEFVICGQKENTKMSEGKTTIKDKQLTFEREFDAPVELVWKAWTDPEMIKKWWGPKYWSSSEAKIDFKVGGKYLLNMRGKMGPDMPDMENWSGGTY